MKTINGSRIIIIAILIFVKVIGITGQAKAEFLYYENYIKDSQEQFKKEWEEQSEEERLVREMLEDTKIITNIDDHSYIVEYLNGYEEYCITNLFEVLACIDNSLIN